MKRRSTQAGGSLLALSIVAGCIFGVVTGSAAMGALAGTAAGIIIATAIWLLDRRR